MKILFVRWHSFMRWGIESAFKKLNIDYEVLDYDFTDWENDSGFCEILSDRLKGNSYNAVFSVNFIPLVSAVCQVVQTVYYSWVYDNPVKIRDLTILLNDCNEIFFSDRQQAAEYAAAGVNAHHLPLAASPEVFEPAIKAGIANGNALQYSSDVSMVSQLYETDYKAYSLVLEPYLKGYLEGIIAVQSKLYGVYLLPELVGDDLLAAVNQCFDKKDKAIENSESLGMSRRALEDMLAREITDRERRLVLAALAAHYDTVLYSANPADDIKGLKYGDYIDYLTQMPLIFSGSRINLNVSLKSIQSGIPLRVLDIMSCGGFVLSNYQEEIAELLMPGEACAVYESIEDMYEKAAFYLSHDSERQKIAAAGRELVARDFTFEKRIKCMFGL